jgi:DNA-binding GntR family transcriptional regulator
MGRPRPRLGDKDRQTAQEILAAMLRRDIRATRKSLANHIRTIYALLKNLPAEST